MPTTAASNLCQRLDSAVQNCAHGDQNCTGKAREANWLLRQSRNMTPDYYIERAYLEAACASARDLTATISLCRAGQHGDCPHAPLSHSLAEEIKTTGTDLRLF